ncbi:hypothetical protein AJ85_06670 [Alkalihalobacillus alcalophilus ATCC 27647 = CGMCC 1.3604]|uniref:Uncharacterized protein n=1 Tax=Alkalihalobacillus alcalophilus ATCC 27647 = CGMCC 1.3604 TaxID=1218173 RepID=A0A094WL17_ALKAL|nr:tetratricopeptide repeat protein [Alkalihalobacillus alcalophilus]KGA97556.1 hypothetical protein BALCAV_0209365 [Alkalihalobacillus alcalophilus ATCC 27647 = CGMCC 1.3604]MED1562980.1 tetratricopeptide repeat protein [Alkalihalobacillus alcalophilus]THG91123.1 hypothetical protein AJ85_06670 [Alkalihalobacillus alcalophilus ATCC 27647 = CGMCC 1.3604]
MELTPQHEGRKVIPFIQNGDYFFQRGLIAYRKKHLQRAVKLFQRAVKLTNQEPVFHVQLAAVLSEMGHYEESNEILRNVLVEHDEGGQSDCYFFMANNYAYLGLFDKAQGAAERYIQFNPDGQFFQDAKDLLDLLEVEYEDISLWNENDMDYEASDDFLIEHEKARNYLKNGDFQAAIPILEEITKKHPSHWAAFNHLAEAFFRTGDERAFHISSHVLKEDESNLFVRANLALFFLQKDEKEQAEPFLQPIRIVYPIDYENYLFVAEVLCAAGEYENVKERFERMADSFYEDSPQWLFCYAVALANTDELTKAIRYLKKSVSLGHDKATMMLANLKKDELSADDWVYHPWESY